MDRNKETQLRALMADIKDLGWAIFYNNATGNIEVMWDEFSDSCHALIFIKDGKVMGEGKKDHEICDVGDTEKLEKYLEDPWAWK
jgi:hypothetical protein